MTYSQLQRELLKQVPESCCEELTLPAKRARNRLLAISAGMVMGGVMLGTLGGAPSMASRANGGLATKHDAAFKVAGEVDRGGLVASPSVAVKRTDAPRDRAQRILVDGLSFFVKPADALYEMFASATSNQTQVQAMYEHGRRAAEGNVPQKDLLPIGPADRADINGIIGKTADALAEMVKAQQTRQDAVNGALVYANGHAAGQIGIEEAVRFASVEQGAADNYDRQIRLLEQTLRGYASRKLDVRDYYLVTGWLASVPQTSQERAEQMVAVMSATKLKPEAAAEYVAALTGTQPRP